MSDPLPRYSDIADTLRNASPDRQWFAEGAIEGAPLIMLCAPEKTGKSWVAGDLVVAAQLQDSWLGRWPMRRQGHPVYFDAEYGAPEWARRYAAMLRGRGLGLPEILELAAHVRHYDSRTLTLHSRDDELAAVLRDVAAGPPALIVVDPLRNHLPPSASENDSAAIIEAFRHLGALREAAGCPVLLLHHVNRQGTTSGSRAITGRADLLIEGEQHSPGGPVTYRARGRTMRSGDTIAGPWVARIASETHAEDPTRHAISWRAVEAGEASAARKAEAGDAAWGAFMARARDAYANGANTVTLLGAAMSCNHAKARKALDEIEPSDGCIK